MLTLNIESHFAKFRQVQIIQSHFDYGLLIWGCAMASNLKPIQSELKEVIKMSFKKTDTQQNNCSNNTKYLHLHALCGGLQIKRPQVLLLNNFH